MSGFKIGDRVLAFDYGFAGMTRPEPGTIVARNRGGRGFRVLLDTPGLRSEIHPDGGLLFLPEEIQPLREPASLTITEADLVVAYEHLGNSSRKEARALFALAVGLRAVRDGA